MLLTAILLASPFPAWQEAEPLRLPTTLDRVTVYGRQGLVERTCRVTADAPGVRTVVLGPFPLAADATSFQVKVERGPAEVQGLEVRTETGFPLGGAEEQRLRGELDGLLEERRQVESELAAVKAGEAFVDSVISSLARGENSKLVLEASSRESLQALFDFVQERSLKLDQDRARNEGEVRRLDARIDDLEQRLEGDAGSGPRRFQVARVNVHFTQPGSADLELNYLVPGASWRPTYDVRVAPDLTGVTVGLVAQVLQNTGEDWKDSEVLLSTSAPHVGLDPPDVPLRIYELPRFRRGMSDAGDIEDLALAPGTVPGGEPPAAVPGAAFGLAAQFLLPERKTVRSDGEQHRFLIREVPLDVQPERYVVPSRSDKAYLQAQVTLTGGDPLIQGPAKVFLGPDFLGEEQLPNLSPGETTTIHLGVDPNLAVEFETLTDEREEPGFLASTVKITRVFRARLTLSAAAPAPVDVLMEEGLPVSRDDQIEITPTQIQPPPLRDPESRQLALERGLYRWRVRLAPGQSQNVRWGYVISHDEELTPVLTEE